jgi:hypothetical protein
LTYNVTPFKVLDKGVDTAPIGAPVVKPLPKIVAILPGAMPPL